jgi:hypothetical protein
MTREAAAARARPAGHGPRRSDRAGSPDGANGALMPERENLNLLGPVTAPEQDQELEERPRMR